MSVEPVYVLRYDEIGLKGGNRSFFERQLQRHVKSATKKAGQIRLRHTQGRVMLEGHIEDQEELERNLVHIPGLHSFSRAYPCGTDLESMKVAAEEALERCWDGKRPIRFRVSTRRSNKKFLTKAVEVNIIVGQHLMDKYGSDVLTVDLNNPEVNVYIEIQQQGTVVYDNLVKGLGGLPVGTAGRLLCLLSGGIDSPVAAFQMMRRGCEVDYVFFENRTFLGRAAYDKVLRLAEVLSRFQKRSRLHVVPFGEIQVAVRDHCTPRNRVVLYRRFMYRIAEQIAHQRGHLGLINGECLGQVASQTLENIHAVNALVKACVYRPLIALDKVDIMKIARQIGTFDISIEDAPDCCSVFMPDRPVTKAKVALLESDEEKLDVMALVQHALNQAESIVIAQGESDV